MAKGEPIIKELMHTIPQVGRVELITVRPQRREMPIVVPQVFADEKRGLDGDHFSGSFSQKRQVTLIQGEHLDAVKSLLGLEAIDARLTRRNIVVRGINLLALKGLTFRIGEAVLECTGLCHPCSRMEENFGPGGYNAMRGHGGITARIVHSGTIRTGDAVALVQPE